jgi:hypothetical protein
MEMKKRFVTLDEKIDQATWSWLRFAKVHMLTVVRRMEEIEEALTKERTTNEDTAEIR